MMRIVGALASRRAVVCLSDGSEGDPLRWYAVLVCEGDLIGKTREQLRSLHFRRDQAWLQSWRRSGGSSRGGSDETIGETAGKRDDGSVEDRESEGERSRKIIRRARAVRERAAESLRRVRVLRKKQGQADAAQKRRRFRRQD